MGRLTQNIPMCRVLGAGALLVVATGAAAPSPPSDAAPNAVLTVGAFSTAAEGQAVPPGWAPLRFRKIPRHTDYVVVKDGEVEVVRAESQAGASGLTREVWINLKDHPMLQWRWKVVNVIQKGDVRKKGGDDYAARIYVTFAYDPDKVAFSKIMKYKMGRLFLGDIPIAALNYVWDAHAPVGTIVDNAYTDFAKMIVVESGDQHVGRWMVEERNVYEDYKRAFGEEPPIVNGVAIMTDTDDTGETATAYYGDIVFFTQGR